jgi:hypothetical protein
MNIPVKFLRPAPHLWILITVVFALGAGSASSGAADSGFYGYGDECEPALAFYRQGWVEILEHGRWTEAERLYREAVAVAPDCVIAKSVLARITTDAVERKALIADIQSNIDSVDVPGRLILDPYLKTLMLISARDEGVSLGDDFRSDLVKMAINNYWTFLDQYPDEWAVRIEYLEWVHARQGAEQALVSIRRMTQNTARDNFRLSYFPAYFYAQLGDYEKALELAREFVRQLGPGNWPQEHYIAAFIAYQRGDYSAADESIRQTLLLDPRHLIAKRLSKKIDAALNDAS